MAETKKSNVENITEDTATQIKPNTVKTQEQFAGANILEMLALNNDMMALNKGELRFKVTKKDVYSFNKTDKDDNPIPLRDDNGQFVLDSNKKIMYEQINSPYVEIIGEGVNGKLSTKKLSKEFIESLQVGQHYIGTYILNEKLETVFVDVVPFNQELQVRAKYLNNGL